MNKNNAFRPIYLPKTNKIYRKGYYIGAIIDANIQLEGNRHNLIVKFRITKGRCQGFPLSAKLKDIYRGNLRLSHLCNAVGIIGELKNPEQLIGKIVKLRVVPTDDRYMGRWYSNHIITHFHPVD